jgi:hypothetical protein
MILEMRKAESSTKLLNSFQQGCRISLKRNALKIGDFLEASASVLGAGVGHSNRPGPDQ